MKLVGLFGHPVSHSLSPAMHNFAFQKLGLPFHYQAFDITPSNLETATDGIRVLNIAGINVTIPYKEAIIPYLDELDEAAQKMGAVNTIVNENGRLIGYNTDGFGYVRSLEEEMQISISDKKIAVLGSGGAARGIVYALVNKGCKQVYIISRSQDKAQKMVQDFGYSEFISARILNMESLHDVDIIINTTPVGMYPNVEDMPLEKSFILPTHILSDIIYNPLETKLLLEARKIGAKIHKGLGMFVYQGALAFEKWTGQQAPAQEMYQFVQQILQDRK